MAAPELERPARELERGDEDRLAGGFLGQEGTDPGPLLAVLVLLVGKFPDRVGVGAGLPGEGATTRGEVALVACGLGQPVPGWTDEGGIEVLLAPAGENRALALVVGALRARVRHRVAADVGLDAAVEVSLVQLADSDRRDVEVELGRIDVVADRHVDLQRLEVGRLGDGPPEVDHVPRQFRLFVRQGAFDRRRGDDLGFGFLGAKEPGSGQHEQEGKGAHGGRFNLRSPHPVTSRITEGNPSFGVISSHKKGCRSAALIGNGGSFSPSRCAAGHQPCRTAWPPRRCRIPGRS